MKEQTVWPDGYTLEDESDWEAYVRLGEEMEADAVQVERLRVRLYGRVLVDPDLSDADLRLLIYLAMRAHPVQSPEGYCATSRNRIGEDLGRSRDWADPHIKRLEAAGYLVVDRREAGWINRYYVTTKFWDRKGGQQTCR